ncbi:protein kinase [Nannocystis sp. RBIL2]|uniref:WD40 repeat domain-containing serine/threonine-protein kinase n=1 Tax=Nannocystis sp. RBIL2 TaxID=2996788 RepID=UPI00226FEFFD|nr:protein kinase [Nannocystis sp. RBIL2]MCY1064215.1 protein kinase [Nannocystis sp. RBIL2]
MSDDPRSVRNTPLRIDPERLAHALARADLKARLFGPPSESERVGRFAVLRRVGAGGMGVVFAAYDEQLDRRIALKLVHPGSHDPAAAARSKREAQALARLSHPNVVQVYEVGEARGHVYIAMEFVQGETLRAWQQRAPRSWRETLAMYVQAGRGLAAAHAVGLVHRDFKPENVLVGDDGRPRVVDFGLARARPPDGAENRSEGEGPKEQVRMGMTPRAGLRVEAAELTAPGAVVGTPAYMAPEQHAGGEADARSDVFCFCVALHEALHGARPFAGERREDVHAAIVAGAIARGPREVPAWLQRVVDRGLQADPAARWPSMDALLTALGRDPTRVRRQLALALALLAALAGGGAWAWQRLEQRHAHDVEEQRARTAATAADLERTQAAEEARRLAAAAGQHADPALRLLLAVAAVSTARERGEPPPLEVEQALLDALDGPRSELFARPGAAVVDALAESGDGRWLATGEREGAVALWSTAAPRAPVDLALGTGSVRGLAFAPDGAALAIARAGGAPCVHALAPAGELDEPVCWDMSPADPRDLAWSARGALVLRDGASVHVLRPQQPPQAIGEPTAELRRALWSPDGATLLTLAGDGALRLWPEAGGPARALKLPAPAARGATGLLAAEWRTDGAEIVVARADHTAAIVPVDGGAAQRLSGHTDEVYGAAFLAGGQQVVTVSRDGSARVWERDGSSERIELQGHEEALLGVQIGPDRNLLLGTPAGGELWLWQLDVRGPPLRLRGHAGSVVAAGFSHDGARVLSASVDGSARRWPIADDPWLLRGHAAGIEQAAFLADARTVVTAGLDGSARVWPRDGRASARLGGHREGGSVALAPSPDGARLLTVGSDGRLRLWSLAGTEPVPAASFAAPRGAAFLDARWSPAGDVAAVAGEDGRVHLVRFPAVGPPGLEEVAAHAGAVRVLQFMSDGTAIASAGDDGPVRVTPLPGSSVRKASLQGHAGPVRALAISGDGGRLASAGDDAVARVWSLTHPEAAPIELRGHAGSIGQIQLRPDGRAALTASTDGTACEWPLDGGEPVSLRGHTDAVWVVAYSPDGAAILTASADGTARLWSRNGAGFTSLRLPHTPAAGPGEPDHTLWTGAFSPDGRLVVTAGADGLARVFPATLDGRLAEACARAGRDLTPAEWSHHFGERAYARTCSS